jgi:glycosyltransferase involved in cell wall biosynthesis
MKKIAVLTMGVRLKDENGYTRFAYLAEFLTKAGYQVDLITTTFQHWEKAQRDLRKIKKDMEEGVYPYGLRFIYEPGYKKNVDLARVNSHRIAAKNLRKMLEDGPEDGKDYDLIYAEIPPNDVARVAAEYAKEKGIPFVADVNDLWPEAMRMVLDVPVVSDVLFYPLQKDAEKVYSLVSGVVGTSDEYRDRPFQNQKWKKKQSEDVELKNTVPKITVYVGNEIEVFDRGAEEHWEEVEKPEGEFWVTYAGTIGTSYDIRTMVMAGEELMKRGRSDIKIKILGGGPMQEELEELAKTRSISNVEFVGYVPYEKMAAYLKKSDILVNSFVKKAPQSIVTKIGDYLAAGKAMINTCMSPEFRAKVEMDGFGVNIMPEDVNILADAILELQQNEKMRLQMGEKAREIAEAQFDRPIAYQEIEKLIRSLIEKNQLR